MANDGEVIEGQVKKGGKRFVTEDEKCSSISAYQATGSLSEAGRIAGVDRRTVKKFVEKEKAAIREDGDILFKSERNKARLRDKAITKAWEKLNAAIASITIDKIKDASIRDITFLVSVLLDKLYKANELHLGERYREKIIEGRIVGDTELIRLAEKEGIRIPDQLT